MHIQLFEQFTAAEPSTDELVQHIQTVLTPDLLKGVWRTNGESARSPMHGHCYAATEALYWLLGGPQSGYVPYVMSPRNYPEILDQGESHWYLMNRDGHVLDVTVDQFDGYPLDYKRGIANGMMSHPAGGSKRARTIMSRVAAKVAQQEQ